MRCSGGYKILQRQTGAAVCVAVAVAVALHDVDVTLLCPVTGVLYPSAAAVLVCQRRRCLHHSL